MSFIPGVLFQTPKPLEALFGSCSAGMGQGFRNFFRRPLALLIAIASARSYPLFHTTLRAAWTELGYRVASSDTRMLDPSETIGNPGKIPKHLNPKLSPRP